MRNLIFAFALITIFAGKSHAQEKIISMKKVPEKAEAYIAAHFPKQAVVQAVRDRDGLKTTYEISLDDFTKLEFNSSGKIIEINGKSKLPDSVIPKKIAAYVNSKYPENFITDWQADSREQKIELNNGAELEFDLKGSFLRFDD